MAVEKFPVEAGHIMMFARAIGDMNPIYYDENYAKSTELGGIVAPPTFIQSSVQYDPEYFLRPKIGQSWFGSGKNPTGIKSGEGVQDGSSARGLHAEQHYEYHRPIRPGEMLYATVKTGGKWEKEGKRAGKMVFSEVIAQFRNEKDELVVTAREVNVSTERAVDQE